MRGHQQLIAMRLGGSKPDFVFIDIDVDHTEAWRHWHGLNNRRAYVQIDPTDRRPDMRWAVGLRCYVQGSDRNRVIAIRDACLDCSAERVIASVMQQRGRGEFAPFKVVDVTDTAGVFEWTATQEQANG